MESNCLFYTQNLRGVSAKLGYWRRCKQEKGPKEKKKKDPRKMASAVFSISYNFIPNGDMFGILDNISEFVQKSIMSS